jgi:hypothetical protein
MQKKRIVSRESSTLDISVFYNNYKRGVLHEYDEN